MKGARVYLTAGGAEGIEAAYHLALRYHDKSGPLGTSLGGHWKKKKLISFRNCYHGSTFVPSSAKPEFIDYGWTRLTEGLPKEIKQDPAHRVFIDIDPPHDLFFQSSNRKEGENVGQAAARMLEETILREGAENVAAFLFEPVQGDGGAVDFHRDFFPLARQICDKYNVIMIADEIMTFAKTGHWFAMQMYGICPDITVISKGLTSGYLPGGAVIYKDRIWQTAMNSSSTKMMVSDIWQHDYTWSGHPVCSAVALKSLEILEKNDLIIKGGEKGAKFLQLLKDRLDGLHLVKQVRGTGVMLGIDLISDIASDIEMRMLLDKKVVLRSSSNKHCLLMTPPIIMTDDEFGEVADKLREVLSGWQAHAENLISKPRQW
ncbi:pyridoxal phosphate-dependent transferase [Gaertneriomyces semiglobifer]|nr:pyridoxal phosphate-dependent transferase [Gaertneriomyces semiglobifer]